MTQETSRTEYPTPIQLILFGSPGTGKSHKVEMIIGGAFDNDKVIRTVFHPEYTYGDFMGKLMPLTNDAGRVTYRYYPGHFMRALALALKHGDDSPEGKKEVLLVIDEINRGNSAAIFGTAFQLLDRGEDGWSSYALDISEMEKVALLKEMGAVPEIVTKEGLHKKETKETWRLGEKEISGFPVNRQIKLPPNLSIVGTMNTSDESIYYMDSAFKRRWAWEYVPVKTEAGENLKDVMIGQAKWTDFVDSLNSFITSHHEYIRKVEDKQIGYYFIKAKSGSILHADIQNKLMFFLWDTVFARSKQPLERLLGEGTKLVTFGEFCAKADEFIEKIVAFRPAT